MGFQETPACETAPASGIKPYTRVTPLYSITNGLCENLRNVQRYRLQMHEEINHALTKLMFGTDRRSMLTTLTGMRKEE